MALVVVSFTRKLDIRENAFRPSPKLHLASGIEGRAGPVPAEGTPELASIVRTTAGNDWVAGFTSHPAVVDSL